MLIQVKPVRDLVAMMPLAAVERDEIIRTANDALIEMRRTAREQAMNDCAALIQARIERERELDWRMLGAG